MTEFQCHQQLLEKAAGIALLQAFAMVGGLVADDIFKHVSTCCILHDDGQVVGCQENLLELHDVGVNHA